MLFWKILDKSNRKPNKILVEKYGEIYNRSIKSWLEKKSKLKCIQQIMNEGKPVVAERFSRTLKNLFMSKFMNTWLQYQKKYILIN